MKYQDAKQINLHSLMERLGHDVVKVERGGTEHKYQSVFREEKEASLNINANGKWYDFGESRGGNPLDFCQLYLQSRGLPHTISDTLAWLDEIYGTQKPLIPRSIPYTPIHQSSSFSQSKAFEEGRVGKLQFIKAIPIEKQIIIGYLHHRGIPIGLAQGYLVQIHYKNLEKNKGFFGFGMANMSKDGYEVRSASDTPVFKTAFNRDISVIEGCIEDNGRVGAVNVFEGMLDALSLMQSLSVGRLNYPSIIMHSLSSFQRTVEYITDQGFEQINLFLDNNPAGEKATSKFINGSGQSGGSETFKGFGMRAIDYSYKYAPHIDLNDALISGSNAFLFNEPT